MTHGGQGFYQGASLVRRHVCIITSYLVKHRLCDESVILRVACVVPVIYKSTHDCTAFPPVVWLREIPGDIATLISVVVIHHAMSSDKGSFLDRCWREDDPSDLDGFL